MSATRRLILAGLAVAAPAALAPSNADAATSPPGSLLDTWRKAYALEQEINADPADMWEIDPRFEDLTDLEDALLAAPISSKDDALAVLMAVGLTAVRGERSNNDDERAYERVQAFLRGL